MRTLFRLLFVFCVFVPALGFAQDQSKQTKIDSATNAGPPSVSDEATIRDWPSEPGGDMTVLREGSNDWTCLPDHPETPGNDPMCLDQTWMEWADAWMNQKPFQADQLAFGYMLQGGTPESNIDPYAEGPTPDNEWIDEGVPHLMILVPDEQTLADLTTDPDNGGPWVMWRDTDYVHIMAPMPEYEAK